MIESHLSDLLRFRKAVSHCFNMWVFADFVFVWALNFVYGAFGCWGFGAKEKKKGA